MRSAIPGIRISNNMSRPRFRWMLKFHCWLYTGCKRIRNRAAQAQTQLGKEPILGAVRKIVARWERVAQVSHSG